MTRWSVRGCPCSGCRRGGRCQAVAGTTAERIIATATVCALNRVGRSTGSIYDPENFFDLGNGDRDIILTYEEPTSGTVVLMLLGPFSCVLIGPFPSPQAAGVWWDVPYNKLRQVCTHVAILSTMPQNRAETHQPGLFEKGAAA